MPDCGRFERARYHYAPWRTVVRVVGEERFWRELRGIAAQTATYELVLSDFPSTAKRRENRVRQYQERFRPIQ